MSGIVSGKVAIVTGAGNGIGKGIALAMAASGARVVVNDISAEAGQKVVDEIVQKGGQAVVSTDSVAERASAERIVEAAMDHFGRLDIVVNNAGILRDRLFHKMNDEEWNLVIDVHLHGNFNVSRAAASHFREQESGAFIHMTSTSGLIGNFGQANYSAAKMGIVGLSKSIALDMARFNVRSNCIAPFAWTAMTSSIPANTPEEKARVAKFQKMEAEKVAPMAVYLGSDAAAGVTGQIFSVRANEIMLFSQPRPVRSVHMSDGWTPEAIADIAIPAMKNSFYDLERSPDVISWDPI